MYLNNCPLAPLNTLQDTLLQSIWIRREQFRVFETMINIFANGLSLSPKLSERIEKLSNEYIELVIPGTQAAKKENETKFIERTASTLEEVSKLLKGHYENQAGTKKLKPM